MTEYYTYGVRAMHPTLFWDFDHTNVGKIFSYAVVNFSDFDIYESSLKRYHLVAAMKSWDETQEEIDKIAKEFPYEHYIRNCRRQRLRVSDLHDKEGKTVKAAPALLTCSCPHGIHREKRIGTLEKYATRRI
jgi:hypothetical protein